SRSNSQSNCRSNRKHALIQIKIAWTFREYEVRDAHCAGRHSWSRFIGTDLDRCRSQAAIKAATAIERPPVVEKDLQRAPIGNPAENEETFLDQAGKRGSGQI